MTRLLVVLRARLLGYLPWLGPLLEPKLAPLEDAWETREYQQFRERHPEASAAEVGARAARRPRGVRVGVTFAGVLTAFVVVVVAVVVVGLGGASRAVAAPDQAAAAAHSAGSFAFTTESRLLAGSRVVRASLTTGEVNLRQHAIKSTVTEAGASSGFERLLFEKEVFTRTTRGRSASFWVGSGVAPPVAISVSMGSAGGFTDTTGLLAVLSHLHHATPIGTAREEGVETWGYRVTTTVGALTRIEHVGVTPALAATPVTMDVWQDQHNRLVRAVRTIALAHGQRLRIVTRFRRYGRPTSITRPNQATVGSQPLNPFAGDPIGASIITAITAGTEHSSASAHSRHAQRHLR